MNGKTYERTHPWIKFALDLRLAPPDFWMVLGEVKSKCEHIAGVPLDKPTADSLYTLYLSRGVQATTAIEGNTLTEEQVRERIEGKRNLPESLVYQGREVDNIVESCNEILRNLTANQPIIPTVELIRKFNKQVLTGLPLEEGIVAGEIRKKSVYVGSYRGAPAEDCEFLLEKMCAFLVAESGRDSGLDVIAKAVVLSVWAHLYIAWIHPFGDGNGRTARLLEFMILLEGGVPAPAAHLLSNHYNQTRSVYYQELDKASRSGGDIVPFFQYAINGLAEGLREQLKDIQGFQHRMIWRDFVHETLQQKGDRESAIVRSRRTELAIALAETEGRLSIADISELTPSIAKLYARKTSKTLRRDINALINLGLVEEDQSGIRASVEVILAFLPPRREKAAASSDQKPE